LEKIGSPCGRCGWGAGRGAAGRGAVGRGAVGRGASLLRVPPRASRPISVAAVPPSGWKPGTSTRSICLLIRRSIAASASMSGGATSEIASPVMPARPVRPMRCT
jgi:hypothetical protein